MLKELKTLLQKYFGISSPKPIETKKPIPVKCVTPKEKLDGLVSESSKDIFGIHVQIEWGDCPHCESISQLLSIRPGYFRCSNCHETIKQYINGRIVYLPINNHDSLSHDPKES